MEGTESLLEHRVRSGLETPLPLRFDYTMSEGGHGGPLLQWVGTNSSYTFTL